CFHEQKCSVTPTVEPAPTSACILNIASKEIEVPRSANSTPSKALLCEIAIMMPRDTDNGLEYDLKVHCRILEDHFEFVTPHNFIAFVDDDLPPNTPEELVAMITREDVPTPSDGEEVSHVDVATPAQVQLKLLMDDLESSKLNAFSSPIRSIPIAKLHHNLTARSLCESRIDQIQMLIESKQLDFNSIIFHVL
uniref:Uncharacterized protein n=1 Tax=Panagrolaimus sp. PS1159 TaxID=55785 RepID=A0AC35GCY3_9BILA